MSAIITIEVDTHWWYYWKQCM